jgi:hypothetical protein
MIYNHTFPESKMLSEASYDSDKQELSVTFSSGKEYTYIDVPKETYSDLINAPSAGRYFNAIKMGLVQK